jgi:hypothetical protein
MSFFAFTGADQPLAGPVPPRLRQDKTTPDAKPMALRYPSDSSVGAVENGRERSLSGV